MAAEVLETIYWLDDYVDEVTPCDCTLQGWADWLSQPDEDWGREEAAKAGEEFYASTLEIFADLTLRKVDGVWTPTTLIPDGADFFALRHGPGLGWSGDMSGGSIEELAELLDDTSDVVSDVVCARHGSRIRVRYELTVEGPRCSVIGSVQ